MNAQLAPIEADADPGRHRLPGPRRPLLRPAGGARRDRPRAPLATSRPPGTALAGGDPAAVGGRSSGYDDDAARAGPATRPASGRRRSTRCSTSSTQAVRADAAHRCRAAYIAELDRRRAARARGLGRRREPADLPPGQGPRVGRRRSCRRSRRGSLPIRQAVDDDALLAEEPRLLYVGITRARAVTWRSRGPRERETRGRHDPSTAQPLPGRPAAARRAPRDPAARPVRRASRTLAGRAAPRPRPTPTAPPDDDPLFAALQVWRTARAREDARAAVCRLPRPDPGRDRRDASRPGPPRCAGSRASARPRSMPTATRSSSSSAAFAEPPADQLKGGTGIRVGGGAGRSKRTMSTSMTGS